MSQLWLIATLMVGATDGASTPRLQAKGLFDAATAEYEAGHYEVALTDFARSYELLPLPELLFDMAQCQWKLGRWAAAATEYARFLQAAPESPHREEAERYRGEAEAKLAEATTAAAPPVALTEAAPLPAAPSAAVSTPVEGRRAPAGAWWLAGGGAAVLVAGAVCVSLAAVELGSGPHDYGFSYSQAQTYVTVGNAGEIGIAAGAALAAGAGLWGWLGARPAECPGAAP
jgi:tetratricopeptide (TPR) repeat protein